MEDIPLRIFIPFNVASSKNSKVNTSKGSFHSKTVMKYLRSLGIQSYSTRDKTVKGYVKRANLFEAYRNYFIKNSSSIPVKIGFHFVRGTRHKADFHNLVQLLADLMVAHRFIEDDSMDFFLPFPLQIDGKWYSYDKDNPGVWIEILKK